MAASISETSTYVYVHQMQNQLCLHKLNNLGESDIHTCAPRLEYMVTGTVDNMIEQLYVCVYKMGDLISYSLHRPTYDRNDREAGTTILRHSNAKNNANKN